MALPVTIPNTFANATTSIPLSQLDTNFSTLSNAINGINSGAETLANLKASNVTITGGVISNVTLDNVTVDVETLSNVTINGGNVTVTNMVASTANANTINVTTINARNGTASISLANTTGIATFSKATVIETTDNTNAALRITQLGTGNSLLVEDSTNPDGSAFVIDASGNVIVGTISPTTSSYSVFVESSSGVLTSIGSNVAGTSPTIGTSRRRTGLNSVVSGDSLGKFSGFGWDATSFVEAARIESFVDGTPGTNDMPGRLVFSTTADGASSTTERMRITSAGEVLIGTTTAASTQGANLQVITAAAIRRNIAGTGGGALRFEKSRSATDGGYTIVQNDDNLGEVQFYGADGVDYAVAATIKGIVNGTPGSDDMPGALVFSTTADGSASVTERARITSAGKFFVNETAELAGYTEQAVITANGTAVALALKADSTNIALGTTNTSTGTYNAAVFANNGNFSGALKGSISVSNSATTYNTSSDYRLKENVAPMTGALATVAQLKPCTYTWKDGGEIGQGFIAHELQEVAPYAVTGEKDGEEMQGVDYGKITPLLTAALQEAIANIKTLEARIAVLEAK